MTEPLRVALLCHSTNPRGGVAHAMALGDALHDAGHRATVVAPDAAGRGFPRPARCRTIAFPAADVRDGLKALVERRAVEYREWLSAAGGDFDVLHAHDGLSGSCVADATAAGLATPYVRTVHHLDRFADAGLADRQARSITAAARLVCVSRAAGDDVRRVFGRRATVISNGVDRERFTPAAAPRDAFWNGRRDGGPAFLAVGGVEARKNTTRLLRAFARVHAGLPSARLRVVGGASLLDHTPERRAFDECLASAGPALRAAVTVVGVVEDLDMPSIYRTSDVLAFPSLHEGFGLAVLEAMACGTPVVASRAAPFTEYLSPADAAFCDPLDVASVAVALRTAAAPAHAAAYRRRGLEVAARHPWSAAAAAHVDVYRALNARTSKGVLECRR